MNLDLHLAVDDERESIVLEAVQELGLVLDRARAKRRALESEALVEEGGEGNLVHVGSREEGEVDYGTIAVEDLEVTVEVVLANKVDDEVDTLTALLHLLGKVCARRQHNLFSSFGGYRYSVPAPAHVTIFVALKCPPITAVRRRRRYVTVPVFLWTRVDACCRTQDRRRCKEVLTLGPVVDHGQARVVAAHAFEELDLGVGAAGGEHLASPSDVNWRTVSTGALDTNVANEKKNNSRAS